MAINIPAKRLTSMGLSYLGSGGSLILSSITQLVTFAILARHLGTDQFALYVTITAFTNVAVQICGLGVQESITRRVARDPSFYPQIMGHGLLLTGATGAILVVAGMIGLPFFVSTSGNELVSLGSIGLLLISNVFLLRFISLMTSSYIGRGNFVVANTVEICFGLIRTAAAVLGCYVFGVTTVAGWSVWFFIAHLIVAAACLPLILRYGRPRFVLVRDEIKLGVLFSTQFIFKAVRQNTDLLILSMLTNAEVVSSYGVARRVLDSSYLSVEALNRLIYPGSAVAFQDGFHNAMERVKKVLLAALVISSSAAFAVWVLAPLMPILFSNAYPSMVEFTRALCWIVVPMAIGAVALEAFGAAGHQQVRAIISNAANIIAAGLVAGVTWVAGIEGAFASSYFVEIGTALAAWLVLLRYVRTDRERNLVAVPAE